MNTIELHNLGKKYTITHDSGGVHKYTTLRDVLTDGTKNLWKYATDRKIDTAPATEEIWALKDISFGVEPGEKLGIIGKNGAGKTTLLKILSRITEPTEGYAKIKGRVSSLLEVGTGFHNELTGRENIYLNGAILGMKKAEIDKKFDEIVDFSGVEKFLDTPVKRYSSGMNVRLAFAVAAHLEPEILIVDEVLAVGDAEFQKKCLGKMDEVSKQHGRTILFVSHNMAAIQQLCSRACLLDCGRLIKSGVASNIISEYYNSIFRISVDHDLSDRINRVGGQSLRLLNYDIKNKNGISMTDVPCGKDFRLSLKFRVSIDNVENLRFGVSVRDKDTGEHITEWNSYYGSPNTFSCEKGLHVFIFKISKMLLAPGQYNLDFIVTAGLEVLDWIRDAAQLTVSDGLFYESGKMPLPGNYPLVFSDFECVFD